MSELSGSRIGIDASHLLASSLRRLSIDEHILALAGDSSTVLLTDLQTLFECLHQLDISPVVVFTGLRQVLVGANEDEGLLAGKEERMWRASDSNGSEDISTSSQKIVPSSTVIHQFYPLLQGICRDRHIPWLTAPYEAVPQLAYLAARQPPYVDAVYTSASALMYGIDTIVIDVQPSTSSFKWVNRQDGLDELGPVSFDQFINACLLSGTITLPALPPIRDPSGSGKSDFGSVMSLMQSFQYDVPAICARFGEDPTTSASNYFEQYQRSRIAVQHIPVSSTGGLVDGLHKSQSPADIHEIIGQRLPDELLFYLQKGMVRANMLEALISHEIRHKALPDDQFYLAYRPLLRQVLTPLYAQSFTAICGPLHRYFRFREVTIRGRRLEEDTSFWPRDSFETTQQCMNSWNVQQSTIDRYCGRLPASAGSLSFFIRAIGTEDFLAHSKTRKVAEKLIVSEDEIAANVVWRFLQIRGYIDTDHALTRWGKALTTAVAALNPDDHLEEAVLLGMELTKAGLLSGNPNLADFVGQAEFSSKEERLSCGILSHVAALSPGQVRSGQVPQTRDRGIAAFYQSSMALRSSLRDLMEMIVAALFLNGDAEREHRNDWSAIGTR